MTKTRRVFALLVFCLTVMLSLGNIAATPVEAGDASPGWVKALPAAQTADQLFIVAGVGQTTAWVSMHEKDGNGQ